MNQKILCNLSDANEVIIELRDQWTIEALLGLGVPEETIEAGYSESPSDYDRYLAEMNELGIDIDYNEKTHEVNIYKKALVKDPITGETDWAEPGKEHLVGQFKIKKTRYREADGSLYYEIEPEEWSFKLK